MIWSLTSSRTKRISGPEKFRASRKRTFSNTIAKRTLRSFQVRVLKALDKSFDGKEAETILAATKRGFSGKISHRDGGGAALGCRGSAPTRAPPVNEITPLTGRDFFARDGIPMIRVRCENNKTRKFREVRVHGHLIEQGLLRPPTA
jgi:hypothetical protein